MKGKLSNIKVPKDTADMVHIYCIFNDKTMTEFATHTLENELSAFRERLRVLRKLNGTIHKISGPMTSEDIATSP